jgi:hypothetical protein
MSVSLWSLPISFNPLQDASAVAQQNLPAGQLPHNLSERGPGDTNIVRARRER